MPHAEKVAAASSARARHLESSFRSDGRAVDRPRGAGHGPANASTSDVLQELDRLPRDAFLARVFRAAKGADDARERHADVAETSTLTVLRGPVVCGGRVVDCAGCIEIQPDAVVAGPATYALVEAQRNAAWTFGPHDLAGQLAHALIVAGSRSPLLLLILHRPPPIPVERYGALTLRDAVAVGVDQVLFRLRGAGHGLTSDEVLARLPDVVAWITWETVQSTLRAAARDFRHPDANVTAAARRTAGVAVRAVSSHGR
jgi:hypothetical protein